MAQSTRKKYLSILLTATLFVVSMLLATCGRAGGDGDGSDSLRWKSLHRLDDSIHNLSPAALPLIQRGLKEAHDSIDYYEYYLRLAQYYWLSERPERVEPCISRIVKFCRQKRDESLSQATMERVNSILASAYVCQAAYMHNFHRDLEDGSIGLYGKAIDLLYESDSKYNLPKTYANLADAYIQCNNIPSAASMYRRALFLVDSLRLPAAENVTLYMGLAQIYLKLGDYNKALDYYLATEKHFGSMQPSMQAYYLCSFGNFYYFTKKYKLSLDVFLRMKRVLEEHGMEKHFDMYLCKVNLSDVYLNLDSVVQCARMLDDVEPYFRKVADSTAIYYCNTIRMGLAMHEGNTQKVTSLIATDSIDESRIPYTMVNIRNRYLRQYYELKGDYRRAYKNLRADILLNDSLEHNRSNLRSAEIMARFRADTLQLHHELAIEHKNATIHRTNMLLVVIIGMALVASLVTLAWIMFLRKRRSEDRLSIMALKLLNMRNRISPHFVFNVINNKLGSAGKEEASELVALSKLIRTNLDMSMKPCVSLEQELDYLKKYVGVERYLLGDDFVFSIDVPDGLDTSRIMWPSMFLQILTENAIKHALKGWEGHKELRIVVRRESINPRQSATDSPMQTVVSVSDNGPGFNGKNLKKSTGLGVITQAIAITNMRNHYKIRFDIRNAVVGGKVVGCVATLKVPDEIRY